MIMLAKQSPETRESVEMKNTILALIATVALVGCGVDGAPTAPQETPAPAGLNVSGEAQLGIVLR